MVLVDFESWSSLWFFVCSMRFTSWWWGLPYGHPPGQVNFALNFGYFVFGILDGV